MAGQRNTAGHRDGSMSFAVVPNYVLHEPFNHDKVPYFKHQYQFRNPVEAFHMQLKSFNNLKAQQHGARYHANWTFAGSGMQSIFLQSGRRSCGGTGVFLPQVQRRVGTGAPAPSKKPAGLKSAHRHTCCTPTVLAPTRVVEALNINVQELNFQLPRNKSKKIKERKEAQTSVKHTKEDHNEDMLSPEILLPKEWTY